MLREKLNAHSSSHYLAVRAACLGPTRSLMVVGGALARGPVNSECRAESGKKPALINTKANTRHVNPIDASPRTERTMDSANDPCGLQVDGQRSADAGTVATVVPLDLTTNLFWNTR